MPSDCSACDWRTADTLLICTDGVADLVDDERIRQLLIASAAGAPCGQARALVAAALQAGGCDNATALVVRNAADAGPQSESKTHEEERARERARHERNIAMRNQGMN